MFLPRESGDFTCAGIKKKLNSKSKILIGASPWHNYYTASSSLLNLPKDFWRELCFQKAAATYVSFHLKGLLLLELEATHARHGGFHVSYRQQGLALGARFSA